MNITPVHIRCESIDKYQRNPYECSTILQAISRSKEILLFKIWSNNVTVANHYAEFYSASSSTQCYTGLCFCLKPRQRTPKHFEYDQIKTKIFGFKNEATKPLKRGKSINHKLPSLRCSLKIQRHFFLWNFHTRFSSLSTDFQFSTRMLIFRKTNPEAEKLFLAFPLAKIPRFLRRI
jgi:hypothetical protein